MNDATWKAELADLDAQGRRRRLRRIESAVGPRVRVDGTELLLLCSNSYLGLATHPEVVRAAQAAAAAWGTGSGASRLVSGNLELHERLEAELARLKGTEDAVLFGTGYQANLGTVSTLVGPGDAVFSDQLNHASLIDACRLSRATIHVYPHRDVQTLSRLLGEHGPAARRRLILTDGVFSMDGDLAPLPELAEVAERHDAGLLVDDAHATGVLGPSGAGLVEALGCVDRVPFQIGTLSKALGSEGGFVAGSRAFCDVLRNRSRAFVYSTAPAPPSVAAALAAVGIMRREPERRQRVLAHAQTLRSALRALGYAVPDGTTPIVPILIGADADAVALARALERRSVFVPAIRPPTVPPGTSRLRATVMATHTQADLDAAVAAFRSVRIPREVLASASASS